MNTPDQEKKKPDPYELQIEQALNAVAIRNLQIQLGIRAMPARQLAARRNQESLAYAGQV